MTDHRERRQGQYAGGASRLLAFAADLGAVWGLYTLGALAVSLAAQLLTGSPADLRHHQLPAWIVFVVWAAFYFSYQWTLGGRTAGMALLGLRVVQANGAPLTARQAFIRTLVLPLSFALLGAGTLGIFIQRERRAFHDIIAGTAVVYSWDARAAHLLWLAHRREQSATASHHVEQ